jgi:hypothetical protein
MPTGTMHLGRCAEAEGKEKRTFIVYLRIISKRVGHDKRIQGVKDSREMLTNAKKVTV